jgi:adenine-specific DNA methylase
MKNHIDFPIVPQTHPPMYLMHKFWARKPHNVVSEYIKKYSDEGDIILDPFCGSGVSALETVKHNRKAVAIDVDDFAIFVTRLTGLPVDIDNLKESFNSIKQRIKAEIDDMYQVKCGRCGNNALTEAIVWKDNTPKEIRYLCTCIGKSQWKMADKDDLNQIKKVEVKDIPYWYPKNKLIWNTRVNVHKDTYVYDLFTKRNLSVLSIIFNEINKIKDTTVKEVLRFTFTSTLPQASKLVFVIRKRGRDTGNLKKQKHPEVGSWATRGYWIAKEHFEINAWNCFETRFNKIVRGKEESNHYFANKWKEAKRFSELNDDFTIFLSAQSAMDLSCIPSDSIDYIFTDPPYGDSVPYLELHYIFSSWLKLKPNFDEEIIISDSPIRNRKDTKLYASM